VWVTQRRRWLEEIWGETGKRGHRAIVLTGLVVLCWFLFAAAVGVWGLSSARQSNGEPWDDGWVDRIGVCVTALVMGLIPFFVWGAIVEVAVRGIYVSGSAKNEEGSPDDP
jgi:hypothetical protein